MQDTSIKPYVIEMQLPDGSWDSVPGYGADTLAEAVESLLTIPEWDHGRYRVAQLVYHYEPVPAGLLGLKSDGVSTVDPR